MNKNKFLKNVNKTYIVCVHVKKKNVTYLIGAKII